MGGGRVGNKGRQRSWNEKGKRKGRKSREGERSIRMSDIRMLHSLFIMARSKGERKERILIRKGEGGDR